MNRSSELICLLALGLSVFTSCSPLIGPTSYQVPNLKEAGDGQVDLNYGVAGGNAQVAFSPAQSLAFTGAVMVDQPNKPDAHRNNHVTLGIGYYSYTPSNGAQKSDLQVSVYGKYGFGSSSDAVYYTDGSNDHALHYTQVNFNDFQIQPQFIWNMPSGNTSVFAGIRASLIQTQSFTTNDSYRSSPGDTHTIEPFVGFRGGAKNLKFEVQAGFYSHASTHYTDISSLHIGSADATLNINFGLTYNFNLFKGMFQFN
jgi:hypothetical protein